MPFKVTQGHRFWYQSKLIYDFLLVINTNLPPVLHRFQVVADYFQIFTSNRGVRDFAYVSVAESVCFFNHFYIMRPKSY